MSSNSRKQASNRKLDELLKHQADTLGTSRSAFWQVVNSVRAYSALLKPESNRGETPFPTIERMVLSCARMAERHAAWHRAPETWIVPETGLFVQFRSLVSHLFDAYPVPNFLAPVWISEFDKPWELDLYLHLAAGKSIRRFELPLSYPTRLTKLAARFFMQAPDDVLPILAYRWAQVRSLGGDDRLARLLMDTPTLCTPTRHEEFWETVIRFLIRNLPLSDQETREIVWFIDQQRFRPAETVWGRGAGQRPLQPDFTLKGRSLMSLRRHMANWRTEFAPRFTPPVLSVPSATAWVRTNIRPFTHTQGEQIWTIEELLTDKELRVEGGIMEHCVATYIQHCARRKTSIWSMKVQQGEQRKRLLTIEVVPGTNTIWQAKGKRNSPPTEAALQILRCWADQEGLIFRA